MSSPQTSAALRRAHTAQRRGERRGKEENGNLQTPPSTYPAPAAKKRAVGYLVDVAAAYPACAGMACPRAHSPRGCWHSRGLAQAKGITPLRRALFLRAGCCAGVIGGENESGEKRNGETVDCAHRALFAAHRASRASAHATSRTWWASLCTLHHSPRHAPQRFCCGIGAASASVERTASARARMAVGGGDGIAWRQTLTV